ncbi:hypothetical protein T265_09748 [Opisthorchis viverrini]|uniref:Uncharacterized protein n=1 Tax=Opisthorchis viverrini TaxID=6198 RepID=A0A074ZFP8_OPIVI|nr:hypothetical protein T265_09748 [Opisthorchis viverrini]KER22060.1 hypothetical protein T265_09748 [Opisthorchis viverrini]
MCRTYQIIQTGLMTTSLILLPSAKMYRKLQRQISERHFVAERENKDQLTNLELNIRKITNSVLTIGTGYFLSTLQSLYDRMKDEDVEASQRKKFSMNNLPVGCYLLQLDDGDERDPNTSSGWHANRLGRVNHEFLAMSLRKAKFDLQSTHPPSVD